MVDCQVRVLAAEPISITVYSLLMHATYFLYYMIGGLPKEMIKALAGDKEIMNMLKDPKMQDIMKAVMTGGPTAMKKYLSDPGHAFLFSFFNFP